MHSNQDQCNILLGRDSSLFELDLQTYRKQISDKVCQSKFLVLGAAGTIGRALTKALIQFKPSKLHLVDLSENNLAELTRDLRSTHEYSQAEFKTFAIDVGSTEFDALWRDNYDYDYVINLCALKHVRSEKDPYTLMRMIKTNILHTKKTLELAAENGCTKYFAVSTDKATNPENLMGATKAIMEAYLVEGSDNIVVSSARFANVLFSDGSLLDSFRKRLDKRQPITAPQNVRRYFICEKEAGELCLISTILGENREVIFPRVGAHFQPMTFPDLATQYLKLRGFQPKIFEKEAEARRCIITPKKSKIWPCYWSMTDTTGEKEIEEFYTQNDDVNYDKFKNIGIILRKRDDFKDKIRTFEDKLKFHLENQSWHKRDLVNILSDFLPEMYHNEIGRNLDDKM
jgi:FlaA1/EpsC-like NDP-sugar epimerase